MNLDVIDGVLLKKALASAAKLLEINKEEVNSLNVFPVPDGDTGTNMLLTVKSAMKQGLSVEDNDAYKIALAASQGSLMGARGNSGVILSQLFRGFANGIKGKEVIDVKTLALAIKKAADTAYKAVMKPTEGTILTVARECGEFAITISKEEKDITKFLERVIEQGNDTLSRTPEMLPVLKQAGVVDAGGKGLLYLYTGFYNAIIGNDNYISESLEDAEVKPQEIAKHREHIETDDIKFGYCTEFMINTDYNDIDAFRNELANLGDSLLVVGGEGIIKVHVHTNNPGVALEKALELGSLKDIKIDNMRFQHEEVLLKEELKHSRDDNKEVEINKEFSFVSVSIGEGIDEVFKDLNVDAIVPGGQTMNPSTEDLVNAINKTHGKNIIILPNNSNIILAAEQTKKISNRNITVIPTKNIPQGIAALLAFSEDVSLEDNIEAMNDNINNVITGQVTYAVRDTEYNNTKIKKDDIIGLSDKDILSAGEDINEVSLELIEKIINDDISIITIFYGNNVDEETANALAERLNNKYEDIDIEVIFGGQPLYYYIFSIE
ncbi:DAK2 domain-containing protein [Tissierella sp. Yu-01]|uniref:DAK2 domain-containing protein n=1 Tax=Tissierella sp. Yu-01 TaxID=3035694 RepID=UPI00240CF279|nr:DAK2 domain-containing protein [Tissierella sp. Yu-01]WFA09802.1 DAK2 domain-containing protein [Tissierella sp. Yu-01]